MRGLAENVVNAAGGLVDGLTADQLLASLRTSRTMEVTPVTRINLSAGAVPPLPQLPIDPLAPVVLPPGLPSVTYRLCAESATLAASCSLPLPLGVPYVADVTGDGSFDVLADLLPGVDTGALTTPVLRLLNRRLPTSEFQGRPLAAHVFVVYDLPQASRRVALGYDGFRRGTTLPEMTDTTYTLGLPAARDAVLDVRAVATHTAPGTSFANTFGFVTTRTDQSDVDPTAVSVQFSPVPTTYSARLRRAQSGAQTLIETALERSSRVDAIAVSDRTSTSPSPRSATQLVVADMPRTARLEVLRRTTSAGEAEVAAAVTTSSAIARLDIAQFEQPDRTSVADYTRPGAQLDRRAREPQRRAALHHGSQPDHVRRERPPGDGQRRGRRCPRRRVGASARRRCAVAADLGHAHCVRIGGPVGERGLPGGADAARPRHRLRRPSGRAHRRAG